MKPMFSYYGSKYKLAKLYGPPKHDLVIEPFAGSAAYSLFWEPKRVILLDLNPDVIEIWNYLIKAPEKDVLNLPTEFDHVEDLNIPEGAKKLIGFWIAKGRAIPATKKSKWGEQYARSTDCKVWGEPVKERIASQLHKIRNWECFNFSYNAESLNDIAAHWFIDPPYEKAGKRYPFNSLDYRDLAEWCRKRKGFIQVCENKGANWLPFVDFTDVQTYHHFSENGVRKTKKSHEVVYQQGS